MKALRLHLKQATANYRREETVKCRMTYPLPPYSTVIGALHKACGYTEYHPMQLSIQGKYGSLIKRVFKEDCFLNSLQDDRGILVKMSNPDMLSSAYQVVATAQKAQGNSFDKGITINVENQKLLEEYRYLNRLAKHISKNKNVIKKYKDKLKALKANPESTKEEIKAFQDKVKRIESAYKKYEEVKYTIPKSHFRTLTKAPKYYELLCDVELVIHIVSDEKTMQDIIDNICNLTAIGRGEDFVEVLECVETELTCGDIRKRSDKEFGMYIPLDLLEDRKKAKLEGVRDKLVYYGTKYLLPKEYNVQSIKGGYRKRVFNRIPVYYSERLVVKKQVDGIYFDENEDKSYFVCLA
ncbi:MAG: CRISPR-associated protein Cas5 [Ruminococcus sp.]|nr:CRISPR-associated protein Cas5 [Ruminococcus sp.]